MNCPGCGVEMADFTADDKALRKCGDCGGLWIDVSDLNRLLLHNNLPGLESLGGRVNPDALPGQCPDCQVDLITVDGGEKTRQLHYDTCESCGGVFLESEFKEATDIDSATKEILEFFQNFAPKKKRATAS